MSSVWFGTPSEALTVLVAGSAASYSAIKAIISGEAPPTKLNREIKKAVANVAASIGGHPGARSKSTAAKVSHNATKTGATPPRRAKVVKKVTKAAMQSPVRKRTTTTARRAKTTTPKRAKALQLTGDTYEVEGFTDQKNDHYLVKWKGFDEQTWESTAHLKSQLLAPEFAECCAYLAAIQDGTNKKK